MFMNLEEEALGIVLNMSDLLIRFRVFLTDVSLHKRYVPVTCFRNVRHTYI